MKNPMRSTISFAVFYFVCFSIASAQLEFNCPEDGSNIVLSNIICDDNGTDMTDDDFISFTVTGNNANSVYIENLPENSSLQNNGDCDIDNETTLNINCSIPDGGIIVNAPSPNCSPLELNIVFNPGECPDESFRVPAIEPIPTLSQWGLIILLLGGIILGVVFISKKLILRKTQPS